MTWGLGVGGGRWCVKVLSCFPTISPEQAMAALLLVLLMTMTIYAWIASPLINGGTVVLQGLWLVWLPLLLLAWLLAGKEGS
jgi:hypothetical protein